MIKVYWMKGSEFSLLRHFADDPIGEAHATLLFCTLLVNGVMVFQFFELKRLMWGLASLFTVLLWLTRLKGTDQYCSV